MLDMRMPLGDFDACWLRDIGRPGKDWEHWTEMALIRNRSDKEQWE
jgi:hypothetical protein